MLWIIVIVMCCLPKAVSEECNETEIIVGRPGEEVEFNFTFSELRDEYDKYISELYAEKPKNEIQKTDLQKKSYLKFKEKMDSLVTGTIYRNGESTDSRTNIVMTKDAFVVKKTKPKQEDSGIYFVVYKYITLGQKVLIITGKLKGRPPPNPVLKPEDNYTSIIQLECHSVSTSIGDCQPVYNQIYTVWYRNGMRMTDIDPTLSQINVTVDHNGGSFTCLTTDYLPCYQRINTTMHFDDVLNIEECNKVFDSETFIVQPEYAPIDVKLEPDQRQIVVNKNGDLLVKCSAKCQPKCDVIWEKELQVLRSSGSISITENITKNIYGKHLKIVNISTSHEGFYACLVENTHKESKKGFTLRVRETEEKVINSVDSNEVVIVTLAFFLAVIVVGVIIVVVVVVYRKCRKPKTISTAEQEAMLDGNGKPEASTDNNSKNVDRNRNTESEV